MEQVNLVGETVEGERERPDTHKYCRQCEEWITGPERRRHPHALNDMPKEQEDEEEEEEDEPEEVGKKYRVEKIREQRECVVVYAINENQAKSQADDKFREGEGELCGGHHLHTNVDSLKTIYDDDEEVENFPGWPW